MSDVIITRIELVYFNDGTVTLDVGIRGNADEPRPSLDLGIADPSADLSAAVLEIREQLRPHVLSALRAAIPDDFG